MRQDVIGLAGGICFIFFILGMMWLWGDLEGWHAISGYTHNDTNTSQERFMSEPFACDDESVPGRSGKGCSSTWYYWKLPPAEATAATRAVVWLCYSLHQIFIWGLIYRAQLTVTRNKQEKNKEKYSTDLRWFNWSMLGVNALFHVLHLVQTHTTYDATAQDVSISSSQSSVIMMICFIFLMEYKERGYIFMWPNPKSNGVVANKLGLHPGAIYLIRRYHGFAFSWACVYTFWYHPMENTWGHTTGFFHTAIVLLQGSLAFTSVHLNKYWRLLNEAWVFVHATTVAIQTGNPATKGRSDLWPIFTFGFGLIFAFTQVYSLPFWKKLPAWTRIFSPLLYIGGVCALCATVVEPKKPGQSGFSRMYEMVFIPTQIYLQVLASWFCLYILIYIDSRKGGDTSDQEKNNNSTNEVKEFKQPSPTKQALCLCLIMLFYVSFILASYFYEQAHYSIDLTAAMICFSFIFSIGVCFTVIIFKQLIGPVWPLYQRKSNKVDDDSSSDSGSDAGYRNEVFAEEKF